MSSEDKRRAVLALKAVEGLAGTLALDLEHNRLWEGDLTRTLQEIHRQLALVRE